MSLTLCGASWYNQKYYLNPAFARLPEAVLEELQILAVEFTEDVGGVFTIEFGDDRLPHFSVRSMEGDARFDEIGAELKIRQMQREKEELLTQITFYYRLVVLGESVTNAAEGLDVAEILGRLKKETEMKEVGEAASASSLENPTLSNISQDTPQMVFELPEERLAKAARKAVPSSEKVQAEETEDYVSPFERLTVSDVSFVPLWLDDLEEEE